MNSVVIHGRCGDSPQIKKFDGGGQVANFTMATDESYKDKNTNQKVEKTEWHRVVANGKLAEVAEKYFQKGTELIVRGKLRTRSYDKDGDKRYVTEIIMLGFDFCGSKQDSSGASSRQESAVDKYNSNSGQNQEPEDDLPF